MLVLVLMVLSGPPDPASLYERAVKTHLELRSFDVEIVKKSYQEQALRQAYKNRYVRESDSRFRTESGVGIAADNGTTFTLIDPNAKTYLQAPSGSSLSWAGRAAAEGLWNAYFRSGSSGEPPVFEKSEKLPRGGADVDCAVLRLRTAHNGLNWEVRLWIDPATALLQQVERRYLWGWESWSVDEIHWRQAGGSNDPRLFELTPPAGFRNSPRQERPGAAFLLDKALKAHQQLVEFEVEVRTTHGRGPNIPATTRSVETHDAAGRSRVETSGEHRSLRIFDGTAFHEARYPLSEYREAPPPAALAGKSPQSWIQQYAGPVVPDQKASYARAEKLRRQGKKVECAVITLEPGEHGVLRRIWIDPATGLIQQVTRSQIPGRGNAIVYEFHWLKTAGPVDPAQFVFKPPKGFKKVEQFSPWPAPPPLPDPPTFNPN
jgi:outer membrane lipoprotein-sorting protein